MSTLVHPTVTGVLLTLFNEFPILTREHHSGMYSILSYYVAKAISFLPVFPVDGVFFSHTSSNVKSVHSKDSF